MVTAVLDESRLLTRDLINFTPPTVRGSENHFRGVAPRVQQKVAEDSIEKSVRFAFKPLQDVIKVFEKAIGRRKSPHVNYQRVIAYLRQYAGQGRARAIETILKSFHFKRFIVGHKASPEMYSILQSNKEGANRNFVLDPSGIESAIQKIIREKKKRVGFGKSGWNKGASALGVALPRWVAGKSGFGYFQQSGTSGKFSITLSNSVRHVQKNPDAITGKAIRRRVSSMENRMKAMTEKGIRRAK